MGSTKADSLDFAVLISRQKVEFKSFDYTKKQRVL
jgi:hypothetical protein